METPSEKKEAVELIGRLYYSMERNTGNSEYFLKLLKNMPEQIVEDVQRSLEEFLPIASEQLKRSVVAEDLKAYAKEIVAYMTEFLKADLAQVESLPA